MYPGQLEIVSEPVASPPFAVDTSPLLPPPTVPPPQAASPSASATVATATASATTPPRLLVVGPRISVTFSTRLQRDLAWPAAFLLRKAPCRDARLAHQVHVLGLPGEGYPHSATWK